MAVADWLAPRQTLAAVLLLALVLHLCFFPFIWGNKTLLASSRGNVPSIMPNGAWYGSGEGPAVFRGNDMGAAGWLPEPDAQLIHNQYLHEKHLPLWNPYQSYGAPLAANMQSQPFCPLFGLYTLHPGPRTFNLFVLARLLLIGFFTYLYLRLFLPFVPSMAGGIAGMLSGYYVLFYNMPELSVNILIPALFFAAERLLRRQSTGPLVLYAVVVCLSILGGMPESSLLVLAFVSIYFLFRVVTGSFARAERIRQLKYFFFAQILGLALAAFLLAPFFEFMRLSFDTHQPANQRGFIPGLQHDSFGVSVFTYVAPLLFGLAANPIAPGLGGHGVLRGYLGVVPVLFALIAAGGLFSRKYVPAGDKRLILFFFASVLVLILKRYGAFAINWIGHLPFLLYIVFPKYEEPLLAFAVAALCGQGMHQFLAKAVSRRRLIASIGIVFAICCAALAFSLPRILSTHAQPDIFYGSLMGAALVLFVAAFVLLGPTRATWIPGALLILLTVEMAGNYIYPAYYCVTRSPGNDSNPYRGAPYIDFLKARTGSEERVFGRDAILHPGWAASFQLADIRGLDAMYYRKYFDFIRFFTRAEMSSDKIGDLVNRFNGMRWLPFDTPLKRRLLQLSSVKFLLSRQPYGEEPGLVQEILWQNAGRLAAGRENLVEFRTFAVAGETKAVLYEHPAYQRLPYRTAITDAHHDFSFSIAMQPDVYNGSMPVCGAGVEFRLEVRNSSGQIRPLYDRYIDPKHNQAERQWISATVDLSAYRGQTVDLLFTTKPGPAGDTCAAWAGWGDPHFSGAVPPPTSFRQVYDREIRIYEYLDFLPRAALFSSVEIAPDQQSALARLGSPEFDIFQSAVVSSGSLTAEDRAAIQKLQSLPPARVQRARIVSYTSQEVIIHAAREQWSFLVLNDSDYPGWKVYVDGSESRWITANYLFRGVFLPPGRHEVRFAYQPASFAAGAGISGAAVLGLAAFAVLRKRQMRHSRVAEANLV